MKISKSLFKNLSRCPNFASIYDMYVFRNLHHIKAIDGVDINSYSKETENLAEDIFNEQHEKALDIFDHLFDEETGEDLTIVTNAQMEAMAEYYTLVEILAAKTIADKFPGKLMYGKSIREQKRFSYSEGEHEYYCYLDIYDECDDGKIRIFEVKCTTSRKFLELGKKDTALDSYEKSHPMVKYQAKEKYNSIFTDAGNGILKLKEETNISEDNPLSEKDYQRNRNKLFDRYQDAGKYVYDIAVERYIIENSLIKQNNLDGINNIEFYLVVLNTDYELSKPLEDKEDYPVDKYRNELFSFIDLTNITKEYYSIIKEYDRAIVENIDRRTILKSCVNKHCEYKKTTECKFKQVCFAKALTDGSVLEFLDKNTFKHINSKVDEKLNYFDLINMGCYTIDQIDPDFLGKIKHKVQYDCYTKNVEYVDKELIELGIRDIQYPIYHLDFESYNCPLPRFVGEHPYSQSVFQFSLHIEKEPGLCDKHLNHLEYLAPDHEDRRREICEKLIEYIDLSNGGTVLVYNESFEKSRLKELAQIFPDLSKDLLNIREHVFDLMFLLKGNKTFYEKLLPEYMSKKEKEERLQLFNFYNNKLHGSFSIKKVLPIFSNLTYQDLTVHNGTEAILTYGLLPTFTKEEYDKYYLALREYCKQDTWAMVEVLWGLKKYVNKKEF